MPEVKFAPPEIFEQILEWSVVATFDLVIEYGDKGIIIARRIIPPYNKSWALPGLRMLKGEGIDDTLRRIAKTEVGLDVDLTKKVLLGQYVGKFRTEHQRQDLSTGYLVQANPEQLISLNTKHFSSFKFTKVIPSNMGAMYKFYIDKYLNLPKE